MAGDVGLPARSTPSIISVGVQVCFTSPHVFHPRFVEFVPVSKTNVPGVETKHKKLTVGPTKWNGLPQTSKTRQRPHE